MNVYHHSHAFHTDKKGRDLEVEGETFSGIGFLLCDGVYATLDVAKAAASRWCGNDDMVWRRSITGPRSVWASCALGSPNNPFTGPHFHRIEDLLVHEAVPDYGQTTHAQAERTRCRSR